ncbi:MAG TPA: phosphatase PAP2 family protein [Candidatus Limnocylindria bacterium]|nr:phosphatase PAP2 family protein [Candidatus Limnocylindria bacterium]
MDRLLPGDEDSLAPDRHLTSALGGLALVTLLLFAGLAGYSRLAPVAEWERQLLLALSPPPPALSGVVAALNFAGELYVWLPLVLGLIIVALVSRQVEAAGLLALSVAGDLVAAVVKVLVERSRPEGALVEHFLGGESFAFPSGHVVRASALAAAVAWLLVPPAWRIPLAVVSALGAGTLMGYARVAAGVHWPSDVLGGLLLGLGWFAGSAWLLLRRRAM